MSQATRILLSLIGGLVAGIALAAWSPEKALAVVAVTGPIGNAWLHGLQMVIVPLVVALLVVGVADGAEAARAGRTAAFALGCFVAILWATTLMSAILTPLLLRLFPLPQAWGDALRRSLGHEAVSGSVPTLSQFFDSVVPSNIVAAAAADAFLPLTIFALVFAFAVTRLPAEQRTFMVTLFRSLADAMVVVINWVLVLAPIGVGALAYGVGAKTGAAAFGALVHYIAIVASVGVIVLLAGYPLARLGARVKVRDYARAVLPAQVVALSTQSSLATLPTMLKASTGLGASEATAGIVLPLAVAVFRATSPAMNLAVAIYVAHLTGTPIGPGQMVAGIATAAITTMGSVSLPGTVSYFASTAPVCAAMGVPLEALGLLVAVETLPDIVRTVGNVTMDVAVTLTTARRVAAETTTASRSG